MPFGGGANSRESKELCNAKIERIHSQPGGVISRRCGLSSKFFDQLF